MVTTPAIFTPIHRNETDYQVPTHEELFRKIAQNFNFLGALIPVGTIVYVEINKIGVPAPNDSIWMLCDGSEITMSASPLRSIGLISRFVPNLIGKHPRCASAEDLNPAGGSYTYNLSHSHGGQTGNNTPPAPNTLEQDGERRVGNTHTHSISADLTNVVLDFPSTIKYVPYMKVV